MIHIVCTMHWRLQYMELLHSFLQCIQSRVKNSLALLLCDTESNRMAVANDVRAMLHHARLVPLFSVFLFTLHFDYALCTVHNSLQTTCRATNIYPAVFSNGWAKSCTLSNQNHPLKRNALKFVHVHVFHELFALEL